MKRQQGLVLLLALVLCLLLGTLAASALRDALIETRMTAAMRDGLQAFEQAEAVLLDGVDELQRAHRQTAPDVPHQRARMTCKASGRAA